MEYLFFCADNGNMKKKLFSFAAIFFLALAFLTAENPLSLGKSDIRLAAQFNKTSGKIEGYHLFIRKKDGLESVMLTESAKDPEGKRDSYSLRAYEFNPTNGNEIRYLNGKILDSKYAKFSLVDSTAEPDGNFGEAFHIFVPCKVHYGYPWARSGTLDVKNGTYINIRAFQKKFCDYTGAFFDNPFIMNLSNLDYSIVPDGKNDLRNENDISPSDENYEKSVDLENSGTKSETFSDSGDSEKKDENVRPDSTSFEPEDAPEILEEKFTDEKTSDLSEKTEVLDFVEKSESPALSEEEKSGGKREDFPDGGESSSAEDKKSSENISGNYLNDGQKNVEKIYDSPEENAVDMHENFNETNDGSIDYKTRSSEIVDSENDLSIGM